ncbi:GTPase IMAP family member 4 isoform X2 [Amia ocellicauda]|uniref:GTPase IMAP family member 4 isoform X2 n=1 Tax=Amia ocellicauda TaxID=2972642 RepID=UPI003464BA9B
MASRWSSSLGGGRQTASPETQRLSELRIVLLGRRGTGKSSSGNTILGREAFKTGRVTVQSEKSQGEVAGRQVTVVRTPGWGWSDSVQETPELVKQEIVRSVSLCPPGPHALLLAIPVGSYSFIERERRSVQEHLELLSERVWRHTIVLFTWGDKLRDTTIEQHIERGGEELQRLVEKCGNRYHVLNNRDRGDGTQVTELLDKIEEMVAGHGGWHITTERNWEMVKRIRQRVKEKKQRDEERKREVDQIRKECEEKEEELKQKMEEEWSRREEELKEKYREREREREEELKQRMEEECSRREEEMKEKRKTLKEEELEKETEESTLPLKKRNSKEHPPGMGLSSRRGSIDSVWSSSSGVSRDSGYSTGSENPRWYLMRWGRQTASPETQRLSELRIVLLGWSGWTGKSLSGNTILGREAFRTELVTEQSEKSQGDVAGRQVTVVDTPGWERETREISAGTPGAPQ